MLIIEDNSVYEIDEECIQKKRVPGECRVMEKLRQEKRNEPLQENSREGHTRSRRL